MSRTKGAIKPESLNHDASHVATLEAYLQKNAGNKLVLNVDDVARLCGLKRSSTFDAVRRGDLPSIRIGRRVFIPISALARLLAGASKK